MADQVTTRNRESLPQDGEMTAKDLLALLAKKHTRDLFVPECKLGRTWGNPSRRLDAWALRRSWAPLTTFGYEIKVSRGDFARDIKWPDYLRVCHRFSFVAPRGLISPDELPEHVGLLVCNDSCTRLWTQRKSAYREIEPPLGLLWYVLMSRVKLDTRIDESALEYWQRWLDDKRENKLVGSLVSQAIQDMFVGQRREIRVLRRHLELSGRRAEEFPREGR